MMSLGCVEMKIEENGEEILKYSFKSISEASEMLSFLKDFFPNGRFLIQPIRH